MHDTVNCRHSLGFLLALAETEGVEGAIRGGKAWIAVVAALPRKWQRRKFRVFHCWWQIREEQWVSME